MSERVAEAERIEAVIAEFKKWAQTVPLLGSAAPLLGLAAPLFGLSLPCIFGLHACAITQTLKTPRGTTAAPRFSFQGSGSEATSMEWEAVNLAGPPAAAGC